MTLRESAGPAATRRALPGGVEIVTYDTTGPADHPAIVLVHGIGMSHLTWAALQPMLGGVARVVSLDLPGFGSSSKPGRGFGIGDFADAVDAAADQLGLASRILVGHSMGAQVAVELAARRPDVVAGAVLIGPVVDPTRRSAGTQSRDLGLDSLREPPRVNRRVLTDYLRGGARWYLSTLGPMLAYPIERRIADITCPVVLMRGERDPIARPAWCERLAAKAPAGGVVVTVPGKAHVIPLTAPHAVDEALRTLLLTR